MLLLSAIVSLAVAVYAGLQFLIASMAGSALVGVPAQEAAQRHYGFLSWLWFAVAVVAGLAFGVVIVIALVIRGRAHRVLTTEEIVQFIKRVEAQTGIDPTKPKGFTLQPDGTWMPMQADQPRK